MARRQSTATRVEYDAPDAFINLDELGPSPVQNPDESPVYRHRSLEEGRAREQEYLRERQQTSGPETASVRLDLDPTGKPVLRVSRLATHVYTVSYLILFSLLGTLARLGLQALTSYPGAPVTVSSVWPNFAGSTFIGFLAEERMLFRSHPTYEKQLRKARDRDPGDDGVPDLAAAYASTKRTIPLYIGLATGFCGSFTSFSSFIRDAFLALSDDLSTPGRDATGVRNGGYSFMALLAVVITTIALSLSGLFVGAHLAISVEPVIPPLPYLVTRKFLDRLAVLLGWGCWAGAVALCIVSPNSEIWRGTATFALVFAPIGCLMRFYLSLHLNGRIASFPLGTFIVNVAGSGLLAAGWNLAHTQVGGVLGCQVFQGIEDGFSGCLTTVSTWVAELSGLRRRHSYVYGSMSVLVSLALVVAIMGGLRWSEGGFRPLLCVH